MARTTPTIFAESQQGQFRRVCRGRRQRELRVTSGFRPEQRPRAYRPSPSVARADGSVPRIPALNFSESEDGYRCTNIALHSANERPRVGSQFAVDDSRRMRYASLACRRPCPGLPSSSPLKRLSSTRSIGKKVVGAGFDVDPLIRHRSGLRSRLGRLLHDVGAGQVVPSLLEDLNPEYLAQPSSRRRSTRPPGCRLGSTSPSRQAGRGSSASVFWSSGSVGLRE